MVVSAAHLSSSNEQLDAPVERSPSRKGALTRLRLLDAAKQVFEEDGFFDARITDITARAEVAHGTFYTYFSSKPEIFREVALAVDEELGAPLGAIILDRSSTATPRDRIREAIRLYLERYRDEAKIMGVIEQVSRHDPVLREIRNERSRQVQDLVAESIGRLQRRGFVDDDLDPTITAAVISSMMGRFPELWLVEGQLDCDFDTGLEHLTVIFINALQLASPDAA
jgi:AcrR family transcriptional regulator